MFSRSALLGAFDQFLGDGDADIAEDQRFFKFLPEPSVISLAWKMEPSRPKTPDRVLARLFSRRTSSSVALDGLPNKLRSNCVSPSCVHLAAYARQCRRHDAYALWRRDLAPRLAHHYSMVGGAPQGGAGVDCP